MMDLEEFKKEVRPGTRRSKLAVHLAAIHDLRESGYTLEQVCEYLKKNGVTMTIAGLSAYLRRQSHDVATGKTKLQIQQTAAVVPEREVRKSATDQPPPLSGESSPAAPVVAGSKKEREKKASQYLGGNPILDYNIDELRETLREKKEPKK